ncbi:hypothetical protein DFR70_12446 [Nocardia tenerifensis]|uniref:Uncharacterized protein n=2 Tax=Nocardia tenerifensis TaxID=228006 RepID=A0A318JTP4_9NOCA|nr:hypothetical protein DFR70_12446 [Nocardia tenerifensis]
MVAAGALLAGGVVHVESAVARAEESEQKPPPGPWPAPDGRLSIDQVWPGVKAKPELLKLVLEESCITSGSPACTMSKQDIDSIDADTKTDVDELHDIAASQPPADSEKGSQAAAPIAAPSAAALSKTLKNIAKSMSKAKNSAAVRKLADKTQQLERIATWAGHTKNSLGTGAELTTGNVENIAKAAVGTALAFTPVAGDLFSLAISIADGNVHDGICAVVSLAATAVGLVLPPVGAVVAAGLAVYQLGNLLWSFFQAEATPRDWIKNPPATAKELFESGASIGWESIPVGGKKATLVFDRKQHIATQTLLMDSKWGKSNNKNRPVVTYNLLPQKNVMWLSIPKNFPTKDTVVTLNVWQNGDITNAECRFLPVVLTLQCNNLEKRVTISQGRPAVLTVSYIYDPEKVAKSICSGPPCVASRKKGSFLDVYPENQTDKGVQLPLPFTVGLR